MSVYPKGQNMSFKQHKEQRYAIFMGPTLKGPKLAKHVMPTPKMSKQFHLYYVKCKRGWGRWYWRWIGES